MFGLTPRSQKNLPLPAKVQGSEKHSGIDDQPSSEEVRLAKALETVLAKKSPSRAPASQPQSVPGLMDREGPGFLWVTSSTNQDGPQTASKISKRWLRRAERESRWARLRRGTQWIVLGVGACAAVLLTLWPGAS